MEEHVENAVEDEAVLQARALLYRRFKVTLPSGRVMHGDFQCLDRQGNLILGNAYEIFPAAGGKNEERHLGMVLIPLAQQKEVQLEGAQDLKVEETRLSNLSVI